MMLLKWGHVASSRHCSPTWRVVQVVAADVVVLIRLMYLAGTAARSRGEKSVEALTELQVQRSINALPLCRSTGCRHRGGSRGPVLYRPGDDAVPCQPRTSEEASQ